MITTRRALATDLRQAVALDRTLRMRQTFYLFFQDTSAL